MLVTKRTWIPVAILAAGLAMGVAGCGKDKTITLIQPAGPDLDRVYVQIERLGNPLVSEVFLAKREHGHHNAAVPADDAAQFTDDIEAFMTQVAGRPQLGAGLAGALLPDMLIAQTSKAPGTAGWLSWALADGYGGRKLTDDVVDAGLGAIFGRVLGDSVGEIPSLTSDNVDANDVALNLSSFPYLANAH